MKTEYIFYITLLANAMLTYKSIRLCMILNYLVDEKDYVNTPVQDRVESLMLSTARWGFINIVTIAVSVGMYLTDKA